MRASASRPIVLSVLLASALTLAACGGNKTRGDGPGSSRIPELPDDAVPRREPRSKYGNGRDTGDGPKYEVWGETYRVMNSSSGYQERGVASWYGKKFHGRRTSNQEVYDMYAMTAAHKSLPLPTYVQVRNLSNNKTIVVRVNDRGPFVHNRIIDLSYAAALKLDIVTSGTGLVEVTAINFDEKSGNRTVRNRTPSSLVSTPAVAAESPAPENKTQTPGLFVQVGAFGDRMNAERRLAIIAQSGIGNGFIHDDNTTGTMLYRVRVGPVADVEQYDRVVDDLTAIGITDPYLISE